MNLNAVRETVKSKSLVTYSTLKSVALAIAILSRPVKHYPGGAHIRLAQKVLTGIKMLVDVDGHNNDRISV